MIEHRRDHYSHNLMEYNTLNNGTLTPFIIKSIQYIDIIKCLLQSLKYLINTRLFNTYSRFIVFLDS